MNRQIECSGPAFPDLINTARKIPLLLVTGGQFFLNIGYCLKDALTPGFNTNLLLAECEVRTASYGPSFFLPFMAQARSARAMKTRKEKTRIHNLPYGLSKRG